MTAEVFSVPASRLPGDSVRSPKTAELLTRRLRRMIVSGELRAGDFLPREAELMTHFGVSRPTLREAVRVLEAESLVEVRRGSRTGARIRVPGPEMVARPAGLLLQLAGATIAEVLTARLGVEPLGAALFAAHGTPEAIAALVADIEVCEDEVRRERPGGAFSQVHRTVVEGSGNRALVVTAGMMHEIIGRHVAAKTRAALAQDDPGTLAACRQAVDTYRLLLDHIRAGAADEAQALWRFHLERTNALLLRDVDPNTVVDILD
ncbi:Transcriptional regulator [Frankia canadensis]|uniref:Transcriptional regulator n=1 Tax=Frankia canadensis TaxID=1836972 RepID=A0A2I2KQU6_9ACTN|nr:GntR family transcriptional regulator [Frankia canadensis]SNQ48020.1 Transcriptional regulator [Frankia canadensis]SOU55310.1 Transcriptional regulator [Frankia canadensis]